MAISAESTLTRILININDSAGPFILQRAFYSNNRTWLTLTDSGYADLSVETEKSAKLLDAGDFVDSFELTDGLFEYRYVPSSIENPSGEDYIYSQWIKFGSPNAIGYSFNNYHPPVGKWGTVVTPDDCRYTYLWGTDFKATNGTYFTDEQIQWFIDAATEEVERQLNINIKKRTYLSQVSTEGKIKGVDYDEEEALYDFSYRKISRYGMIQTKHRPIIKLTKCKLINRGNDKDLLNSCIPDKKQGVIKFLDKIYMPSDTTRNIQTSLNRHGQESFQPHLFYAIDYSAGYESSDEIPQDLRQIIGKVAAVSLLNVIGDGLMSGFSSSSLSMDGISESFSSTQSATSSYYGARIKEYKDDIKQYYSENKFKFGFYRLGCL